MKKLLIVAALVAIVGLGSTANSQEKKGPVYATFKTSMGDIVIQLFEDKAPKTVANFIALATGTKEWTDPNLPAFGCIADLGLNFAPLWDQLAPQRALKLDVRGG